MVALLNGTLLVGGQFGPIMLPTEFHWVSVGVWGVGVCVGIAIDTLLEPCLCVPMGVCGGVGVWLWGCVDV